jgi:hypothetical protein
MGRRCIVIEVGIYIVIGIAIGWCWPQPKWAATLQAKVVAWVKGLLG